MVKLTKAKIDGRIDAAKSALLALTDGAPRTRQELFPGQGPESKWDHQLLVRLCNRGVIRHPPADKRQFAALEYELAKLPVDLGDPDRSKWWLMGILFPNGVKSTGRKIPAPATSEVWRPTEEPEPDRELGPDEGIAARQLATAVLGRARGKNGAAARSAPRQQDAAEPEPQIEPAPAETRAEPATVPARAPAPPGFDDPQSAALGLIMGLYDHIEWIEKRILIVESAVAGLLREWKGEANAGHSGSI